MEWKVIFYKQLLKHHFSNSGVRPSRGRDAILEGVYEPGSRYAYTILIDSCLIYSEWGAQNSISFHEGPCKK